MISELEGADDLKERMLKVLAGIKILEQLENMGRGVEVSLTKEIITSVLENKKEMNEEERLNVSLEYLENVRKVCNVALIILHFQNKSQREGLD